LTKERIERIRDVGSPSRRSFENVFAGSDIELGTERQRDGVNRGRRSSSRRKKEEEEARGRGEEEKENEETQPS
jgi:hypothetical protein